MTKNPLINAISAFLYIIIVVLIMQFGTKSLPQKDIAIITPIAAISLFTLSAAVMAYIFGYYPLILFFDKRRKESIDLFLKTTLIFGAITGGVLIILFSGLLNSI